MMRTSDDTLLRWPLATLTFLVAAALGIALAVADLRFGLGAALVAGGVVMLAVIRIPDRVVGRSALLGTMGGTMLALAMLATF